MLYSLKYLLPIFCICFAANALAQQTPPPPYRGYFKIHYLFAGLGGNFWEMQPMFDVENKNFTYKFGEVWMIPGEEKPKPDTVITGTLRQSSIDSIVALLPPCRDTTIKKFYFGIIGGGVAYLDIYTNDKSICFYLDNAYNDVADKITAILNTYIPSTCKKLYIPHFDKEKQAAKQNKPQSP